MANFQLLDLETTHILRVLLNRSAKATHSCPAVSHPALDPDPVLRQDLEHKAGKQTNQTRTSRSVKGIHSLEAARVLETLDAEKVPASPVLQEVEVILVLKTVIQ